MIHLCLFLGAISLSSGVFGDDLESTAFYSVECSGNEVEIQNCSYSTTGTCTEHSAAVICQGVEGMKNNDIVIFSVCLIQIQQPNPLTVMMET